MSGGKAGRTEQPLKSHRNNHTCLNVNVDVEWMWQGCVAFMNNMNVEDETVGVK